MIEEDNIKKKKKTERKRESVLQVKTYRSCNDKRQERVHLDFLLNIGKSFKKFKKKDAELALLLDWYTILTGLPCLVLLHLLGVVDSHSWLPNLN